mmetsp:Transcript_11288/g.12415  ORF Transcript_11288/g.12415 Transcript_11288/m.12415 type:complete len:80 (+) Transcript_11288:316-555(+)
MGIDAVDSVVRHVAQEVGAAEAVEAVTVGVAVVYPMKLAKSFAARAMMSQEHTNILVWKQTTPVVLSEKALTQNSRVLV